MSGSPYGIAIFSSDGSVLQADGNLQSNGRGSVVATGNITAYGALNSFSDKNLKHNIKTIENALFKVRQIRGVTFDWVDSYLKDKDPSLDKRQTGVIAQEIAAVLPEVVTESSNGELLVSYDKIIGLVIQSINELADQVDEIEKFIGR